jgi:signal transduction histidine kinase
MHLLSAMGDQIAIAIAKAKMLEEIKSTQDRLVQSEKLTSLGELVSSIAHEIINPLTPIIGYSQRLLMRPGLDENQKRLLEIINSSAQRLANIIEKLLSFSRKDRPLRTH